MNMSKSKALIARRDSEIAVSVNAIEQVSQALALADQDHIKRLFQKHKEWAKCLLSLYYPFLKQQLEKYGNKVDGAMIFFNRNVTAEEKIELVKRQNVEFELVGWLAESEHISDFFSVELLEEFVDLWNWGSLSRNASLPWTESIISQFDNMWDWEDLSCNDSLP